MPPSSEVVKSKEDHEHTKKHKKKAQKRPRVDDSADATRPRKKRQVSKEVSHKEPAPTPQNDTSSSLMESTTKELKDRHSTKSATPSGAESPRDMGHKRDKKGMDKIVKSKNGKISTPTTAIGSHAATHKHRETMAPTTVPVSHAGQNVNTRYDSGVPISVHGPLNPFPPGSTVSPEDVLQLIQNMDITVPSGERAHEIPRSASGSRSKRASNPEKISKDARLEVPSDVSSQAHLLATIWYDTKELKVLESKGMQIRRGMFTKTEKQAIETALDRYASVHNLSQAEVVDIIFTKKSGTVHESFWTDIAASLPMRPLITVHAHLKRAYHPLRKQGKWSAEEDEKLALAVKTHGTAWVRVSEEVGRMEGDCRDRYRNHLMDVTNKAKGKVIHFGPWTKEEEKRLIAIMEKYDLNGAKGDEDLWWAAVVREMGGTRSRAQLRIKWLDCLSKTLKTGGSRRWLPIDHYILIHKIVTLEVNDESEIVWTSLSDEGWNLWSGHELHKRWNAAKKGIIDHENMPFHELLDILMAKKGSLSAEEIEAAIKMTQEVRPSSDPKEKRPVISAEFIDNSDDESD